MNKYPRTAIFIFVWPDGMLNHHLYEWLFDNFRSETESNHIVSYINVQDVVVAKNTALNFALKLDFDRFLFCDNDIKPSETALEIFNLETDIRAVEVPTANSQAWYQPDSFHSAFWLINKDALEKMKAPWFERPQLSENGTKLVGCNCQSLRTKALEAGLTISHAGYAEHDKKRSTWC